MKKNQIIQFIFIIICVNQLYAETESIKLGAVFPLEEKEGRVRVAQTCLINRNRIVEKGALLRVLFQLPRMEDADVKRAERKEKQKRAYSADRELKSIKVSPQQEALKQRALATTWTNSLLFRAMLNRTEFEEIYMVIEKERQGIEIESIDFPEGLLLVEKTSGVEVAWVDAKQSAKEKGFRMKDRILSINGEPIKTLHDFQRVYLAAKSRDPLTRTLMTVEVRGADETMSSFLNLKAPPSLSGSLLDTL